MNVQPKPSPAIQPPATADRHDETRAARPVPAMRSRVPVAGPRLLFT
jgi:hypothetical protein